MMKGLSVLHIPRRFVAESWGGTETMILETSKRLIARGHRAEILSTMAMSSQRREVVGGVPVNRARYFYPYLGLREGARAALDKKGGNLFSFDAMRQLERWPKLDIIHLHTGKRLGGIGRVAARRRGVPYVISVHGGSLDIPADEAANLASPTRGSLEWGKILGLAVGSRRVFEDADAILCVGETEARKMAQAMPHKRVETLPNGVDLGRFDAGDGARFRAAQHIPPDAPVLLCVGRLDPQKNQALAVRALAQLGGDAHLVLIGPQTQAGYRAELEQLAHSLGLHGRVHVTGQLPPHSAALADAFCAADIFVLPSRHEPFGIVILEAWAAGLPVVATAVGGVRSLVSDGHDGLLTPPGDDAAMVSALAALVGNKARQAALGAAGRSKAQASYSWERITGRLESIYCEVIGEHPFCH